MAPPVKITRENSIKEASVTLFLSNPIIKPDRFKDLINHPAIKGIFQSFEPVGTVNFHFANKDGNINSPEPTVENDAGFKLQGFEDGKPIAVLQGLNNINNPTFSFHLLKYNRWNPFLEKFKLTLKSLLEIQKEFFIAGVALHYIDEFFWEGETEIDLSKIILAKDYLPQNFIKIQGGQFINTRECNSRDGLRLYDRLQVDVESKILKNINISHSQTMLIQDLIDLSINDSQNKVFDFLNELHDNNKSFLKEVLLDDVKKLIKLT